MIHDATITKWHFRASVQVLNKKNGDIVVGTDKGLCLKNPRPEVRAFVS